MTVADIITRRKISEVLHFTTNHGVLGMFAIGAILARSHLPREKYLAHVWKANAKYRKDTDSLGHVSLSISRLNTNFFGASRSWHRAEDLWWCVLSIDPVVLTHDGVIFVTTNNFYLQHRKRAPGADGLEALFADPVAGRYGHLQHRTAGMPDNWTTDVQAEGLYPDRVPTEFVKKVYVVNERHADIVGGQYEMFADDAADDRPELPIEIRPDVFA
jgi:hypothetical protein